MRVAVRACIALFLAGAVSCGARTELGAPVGGADLDPDFAWYKLDESSGSTAHDSTPHHYDMNVPGVTFTGQGAVFDGACGFASVDPSFRSAPVTINAWLTAKLRADQDINQYFFTPFPSNAVSGDVGGPGGFGIGLNVWTNGAAFEAETGTTPAVAFHNVVQAFAADTMYMLTEIVEPSSARLYVNGSLATTVVANSPLPTSPAPLRLGCHNTDGAYGSKQFFTGTMRDVRVYKRDLADADVARLYDKGPV